MAKGMNWGIFSLLGVIVLVLAGVACFFVYLSRRAAALAANTTPARAKAPQPEPALASEAADWMQAPSKV